MAKLVYTIQEFAEICHNVLRSDRDVNIGVGGFTGEGKSCFASKLAKEYSLVSKCEWNFGLMTWNRTEMMEWIDGKKGTEKDENGLRENQLPEYSVILPDELFKMFYRRNWFDEGQQDAIAVLNMCRDRHLLNIGNIPNFWELDGGFQGRVRFYIYIPRRGIAWVFQQETNPFSNDPWNVNDNKKRFRKSNSPFKIPNFLCQINYDDWDADEKIAYYKIRNEKRLFAVDDKKAEKQERYKDIKDQRDKLIRLLMKEGTLTQNEVAEITGLTRSTVSKIQNYV